MIVLVPISHFRVAYEMARGRRYSRLDSLVLRAVEQGESTIEALQDTFKIHRRLLTEALVTLIQGGFLALAGRGRAEFLLTHEAEEVLRGRGSLASKVVVPSQRTSVVMERLTGALASGAELRFIGRRDVNQAWTHAMRLEPQVHHNELDEAQVRHLLPRGQGEWIQWIGPINLVGKDGHWVPVDVDLERGRVVGIPDRWDRRLAPLILEQAGVASPTVDRAGHLPASWRRQPRRGMVDPEGPRLPAERWNLSLDRSDLLVTKQDHDAQFRHMLAKAKTSVLIGSAFATVSGLERIRSDLVDTASRGVRVDLLWGYAADQEALAWLKKLQHDERLGETLRFNRSPSGSHAKLVIADVDGVFEAAIGSRNWLSVPSPDEGHPREVTVVVRRAGLVAHLCLAGAALWRGASTERLASAIDRWARIASALDAQEIEQQDWADSPTTSVEDGASTAALVIDREHEHVLRVGLSEARSRVLVASHRLGPAARHRLLPVADRDRQDDFSLAVRFGENVLQDNELAAVEEQVIAAGGTIRRVPTHAKVVVADDRAVVGSYDYLTADPYATARRTRELSIELSGGACAGWIWELMI